VSATPADAGGGARPHVVAVALAVTLLVQTITAMGLIGPAVLAPLAAAALGIPTERIGIFVAVNYGVAMFSGLAGAVAIARVGSLTVLVLAAVVCGLGLALGGTGSQIAIVGAGVAIGIGYGLVNPVSSHMLVRVAPPRRLALILSIKQTGVPVGGALAGAIMPSLALWLGWQGAIEALAAASIVSALACLAARPILGSIDPPRDPEAVGTPILASVRAALSAVWQSPRILQLALASLAYSGMQIILFTYTVTYLKLELAYSIVAAGLVFSAMQIAGIGGRIFWGAVSDRMRRPRMLLGALGIVTFALTAALLLFGARFPVWMMTLFCVVLGGIAIGWNGVHFAEVARAAARGSVGQVTGGVQFFTFMGALSCPALFVALVGAAGSYAIGFAMFALLPLAMGLSLVLRPR